MQYLSDSKRKIGAELPIGGVLRITVVTVVKNAAATVLETVDSVQGQDHPDVEHIVVDGGSTDGTVELLQAAGRSCTLVVAPDHSVYEGFNRGLELATGDVVGFLNGDDVFDSPGVLTEMAAAIEREALDAIYGDLVYVQRDDLSRVVRYWQAGEFAQQLIGQGWMPPHPTLYARRELLKQVGQFDGSYRISGDYEFFLRLMGIPGVRFGYVPSVLVRMRAGGMSNWPPANHLRKWREDLRAMRQHGVGGLRTLVAKNLRKLPQVITRRRQVSALPAYRPPVRPSPPAEIIAPRQPA